MFRILTAISVFTLTYVIPAIAETAKIDPATEAMAKGFLKGILGLFIFVIIIIAIGIGLIYLIWKIFVKVWFKEKEKYETKQKTISNPPNPTTPNFKNKEEYLKWRNEKNLK